MNAFLLLATLSGANALDPTKVPPHALAVDDGGVLEGEGPLVFAVIGNTRPASPTLDGGRSSPAGVTDVLVADILKAKTPPDFVLLTGDQVRSSTNAEWSELSKRMASLLDARETGRSAPPPEEEEIGPVDNPVRVATEAAPATETPDGFPVVVAAGDRDGAGDDAFVGWGAAFPGVGVDIGYNRVASWYSFDVKSSGAVWRFVVLDANKKALGSRWTEETRWFAGVCAGTFDHMVLVVHEPLYNLAGEPAGKGKGPAMDPQGALAELMKVIDEHAELNELRAVIAAGPSANQVFLPDGPFGTLFLNAGGGGAPAEDVWRWASFPDGKKVQLEPNYDLTLMAQLEGTPGISSEALDAAKAKGESTGLIGRYDGAAFPTYGWWEVTMNGGAMSVVFHHWRQDRGLQPIYAVYYQKSTGWKSRKL